MRNMFRDAPSGVMHVHYSAGDQSVSRMGRRGDSDVERAVCVRTKECTCGEQHRSEEDNDMLVQPGSYVILSVLEETLAGCE
jgi:hypothetical protein